MRLWPSIVVVLLLACSKEPQKTPPGEDGPVQESWNAEVRITEEGLPRCTIQAKRLLRFEEPERSELEGVKATFYDQDGRPSVQLTAEKGVVYTREDRIEVEGNVVLTYGDSLRVETERAQWDRRGGKIVAEGPVEISTPRGEEQGEGFVCDTRSGKWSMRSVRGRVRAP